MYDGAACERTKEKLNDPWATSCLGIEFFSFREPFGSCCIGYSERIFEVFHARYQIYTE